MSVIVTNAKSRIAYNICKSLGKKGIDVVSADFVKSSMSFYSRYSKDHFLYPSPFSEPERFVECFVERISRHQPTVLLPVSEETFLFAKYADRFSSQVKMALPRYDQILTTHNKDQWQALAAKLDIATPKNYSTEELRTTDRWPEIAFPVLIKPKQGGGAWGIRQFDNAEALKRVLKDEQYCERSWDRFFVQEKIIGPSHCVAMIFSQGEYRAKAVYRQLRDYPVDGGQATLRVSLDDPLAAEFFQRLLTHLGWHGVCQADFIVDEKTGVPYLIDINPRFWGSVNMAIAAGVDFPYLLYRLALDGDIAVQPEQRNGVTTRWIGGEARAFWPAFKRADSKAVYLKQFFCPGKPIYYDDFSLADPVPFFVWGADVLGRAIKKGTTGSTSHDSLDGVWE